MFDDKILIRLLIGAFIFTFLFTFPTFFFSVDELSYCSRALAFAQGTLAYTQPTIFGSLFSWAPADYPLGTASLLTPFAVVSKNLIFLSGLIYASIALLLHHKSKEKTYLSYLIFFLFIPTIYFSRGIMSEMPSLMLVAFFTYLLFNQKEKHFKYIVLGFLSGLSIWLRETNLVLCGGLVALSLLQNPKFILSYGGGAIIGFLPRILTSTFFYDQVAYVKKYAPFGIEYFLKNIPLYGIILLILFPAGLYVLYRYKGQLANSIKLAIGAFTLLHLVYGYNSGDHSGFLVSLFYNGRYYIPTLPLWMIVYDSFAKSNSFLNKKAVKIILMTVGLIFIISSQVFFSYLEKEHKKVAIDLFENYNHAPIFYDNSAYRYLNPLHGEINELALLKDFKKEATSLNEKAFLVLSHRNNSGQQANQWDNQLKQLQHLKDQLNIEEVKSYRIFDGTNVVVFQFTPLE